MDMVLLESHRDGETLDRLRKLPFVKALTYKRTPEKCDTGFDGTLEVETPYGLFHLAVEAKRSYISRSAVNQLVVWLNHLRTPKTQGIILLARHIPRRAAEALIEARVNFADDTGNVHLELGDAYSWTSIGIPTPEPISERRQASPALLQLLFQFVTYPESVNWPVRQLEAAAGISKSKAAQARRQMSTEGLLTRIGKHYQLGPTKTLTEYLIQGYAQVLRPKLTLGTFRPAENTAESFLSRLRVEPPLDVRYALTGGHAANLLQHFYRGPEVTLFLTPATRATVQQLRLLPDRQGTVTVLKAFGELVFWKKREDHLLASPWLIYAELMSGKDPRAQEAAQEFRREFIIDVDE